MAESCPWCSAPGTYRKDGDGRVLEYACGSDKENGTSWQSPECQNVGLRREIKRLRGVIGRNCQDPRDGVGPGDPDIIRAIHQEMYPFCDCGDCNDQRREAAEEPQES